MLVTTWPEGLREATPIWWPNPRALSAAEAICRCGMEASRVAEAIAAWQRYRPLIQRIFPETAADGGAMISEFVHVAGIEADIGLDHQKVFAKCDHALKATGSIKARGGVFEVLQFAEGVALKNGLVALNDNLSVLADPAARSFFSTLRLLVGSTGNLGFSVGLAGRRLGFEVEVHMSRDAKEWKKNRLNDLGAQVVEHGDDYSKAVAAAREAAATQAKSHFIDDEHSLALFMGYSAAATELAEQLRQANVVVDMNHPLVVYLPCGVGGAPGGIAFGLKLIFGDAVSCIFVEPVASPCMLVQLASGSDSPFNIYDCGLDNHTAADGLAVAQASMLVARAMNYLLDGIATVDDDSLYIWAERAWRSAGLRLEPSAAAGFAALATHGQAIVKLCGGKSVTNVVWTTGGAFLPDTEFNAVQERGRNVQR